MSRAQVPASALSALVISVDPDAHERLRHRASTPVNPASVMKLVTTYAAIDLLGSDFTWNTRFYTDGTVENGVLRGNLYVRGGGDPKFVLERIQEAYLALQAKGVRVILGDMVLDHSAFELPAIDPGAFDGEALRPYNATPDALLVNFKSVILTFQPDLANGVARVVSEPPMAGLAVDASVPLSRGTACGTGAAPCRPASTTRTASASRAATRRSAANSSGPWPTSSPRATPRARWKVCGAPAAAPSPARCATAPCRPRCSCCTRRARCPCPRSSWT